MMSKLAENSNVIVLKIGKAAEKKLKRGLPASLGEDWNFTRPYPGTFKI